MQTASTVMLWWSVSASSLDLTFRKKGTMVPTVKTMRASNVRFWMVLAPVMLKVFSIVRITCKLLMIPVCSFGIFGMGRYACVFWHFLALVWSMICSLFLVLPRRLGRNSCRQRDPWELWKVSSVAMLSVWCLEIAYATYIIIHNYSYESYALLSIWDDWHHHCKMSPQTGVQYIMVTCPKIHIEATMNDGWKLEGQRRSTTNHGEFSMDPHLPLWLLEKCTTTGHV